MKDDLRDANNANNYDSGAEEDPSTSYIPPTELSTSDDERLEGWLEEYFAELVAEPFEPPPQATPVVPMSTDANLPPTTAPPSSSFLVGVRGREGDEDLQDEEDWITQYQSPGKKSPATCNHTFPGHTPPLFPAPGCPTTRVCAECVVAADTTDVVMDYLHEGFVLEVIFPINSQCNVKAVFATRSEDEFTPKFPIRGSNTTPNTTTQTSSHPRPLVTWSQDLYPKLAHFLSALVEMAGRSYLHPFTVNVRWDHTVSSTITQELVILSTYRALFHRWSEEDIHLPHPATWPSRYGCRYDGVAGIETDPSHGLFHCELRKFFHVLVGSTHCICLKDPHKCIPLSLPEVKATAQFLLLLGKDILLPGFA